MYLIKNVSRLCFFFFFKSVRHSTRNTVGYSNVAKWRACVGVREDGRIPRGGGTRVFRAFPFHVKRRLDTRQRNGLTTGAARTCVVCVCAARAAPEGTTKTADNASSTVDLWLPPDGARVRRDEPERAKTLFRWERQRVTFETKRNEKKMVVHNVSNPLPHMVRIHE